MISTALNISCKIPDSISGNENEISLSMIVPLHISISYLFCFIVELIIFLRLFLHNIIFFMYIRLYILPDYVNFYVYVVYLHIKKTGLSRPASFTQPLSFCLEFYSLFLCKCFCKRTGFANNCQGIFAKEGYLIEILYPCWKMNHF